MKSALVRHHGPLQQAIESAGGYVFQIVGDAFCAAFHTASEAVAAARAAQRALTAEPWGETGPIRVRMALHTGTAQRVRDAARVGELPYLARVVAAHGRASAALSSLAAADARRRAHSLGCSAGDRDAFDRAVAAARAQLDEATADAIWSNGATATLDQAIARPRGQFIDLSSM